MCACVIVDGDDDDDDDDDDSLVSLLHSLTGNAFALLFASLHGV
jgi:hypothetical protein